MPALAAAAMLWAGGGTVAADEKPVQGRADSLRGTAQQAKRAPAEVALGGVTFEERMARQDILHARLTAEMPDGVLESPISVELTQQDREDLATPYESGTPLRIGVIKTVTPAIEVVEGKGLSGGAIQETEDGGFVWAMAVTSPEARAIRVHFTDFSLPRVWRCTSSARTARRTGHTQGRAGTETETSGLAPSDRTPA